MCGLIPISAKFAIAGNNFAPLALFVAARPPCNWRSRDSLDRSALQQRRFGVGLYPLALEVHGAAPSIIPGRRGCDGWSEPTPEAGHIRVITFHHVAQRPVRPRAMLKFQHEFEVRKARRGEIEFRSKVQQEPGACCSVDFSLPFAANGIPGGAQPAGDGAADAKPIEQEEAIVADLRAGPQLQGLDYAARLHDGVAAHLVMAEAFVDRALVAQ